MHAARPLFAGREASVAAAFGLVHGLAFAATLNQLGARGWRRVVDLLAFNLGIEAMQLLVVAMVLPALLLLSRGPLYRTIRTAGAAAAGAVSIGWMVERLWDVRVPVDGFVDAVARPAGWITAAAAVAVAVTAVATLARVRRGAPRIADDAAMAMRKPPVELPGAKDSPVIGR